MLKLQSLSLQSTCITWLAWFKLVVLGEDGAYYVGRGHLDKKTTIRPSGEYKHHVALYAVSSEIGTLNVFQGFVADVFQREWSFFTLEWLQQVSFSQVEIQSEIALSYTTSCHVVQDDESSSTF